MMIMKKVVKGIMCIGMCISIAANTGALYAAEEETPEIRFLDPEIIDEFFTTLIAEPINEMTGGLTLEIPELSAFDTALDAFDEISPIDFELGFTVASAYIWRGQNLGTDASFQPYVTASPSFEPLGDLRFTYWADITKNEQDRNEREFDYAIDYNVDFLDIVGLVGYDTENSPYVVTKIMDFNFDTGYIYYDFPPNGGSKSQEVYFGVAYNLPLSPSFFVYNDWDRGRGLWMEWGISQDIPLGIVSVSTYATMGYNKDQWGESSALSTLDFGASIPIALGTHMTIEPFLSYTKRLNATYSGGSDLTHDELYGGFNWSVTF